MKKIKKKKTKKDEENFPIELIDVITEKFNNKNWSITSSPAWYKIEQNDINEFKKIFDDKKISSLKKLKNQPLIDEIEVFCQLKNDFSDEDITKILKKLCKNYNSIFNRFCNMFKNLADEEQSLILKLTDNFLKINIEKYLDEFTKALSMIKLDAIKKHNNIYFIPLLKEDHITKFKSSCFLIYLLKDYMQYYEWYNDKKLHIIDNIEHLPKSNKKDYLVCVIDDYIGSGETTEKGINFLMEKCYKVKKKTIDNFITNYNNSNNKFDEKLEIIKLIENKYFSENKLKEALINLKFTEVEIASILKDSLCFNGLKREQIIIIALAAQQDTITNLENSLQIKCYIPNIIKKGISDYYEKNSKEYLNIMRNIGEKLNIDESIQLGYNNTEALIKMHRTPNNTFAIFWRDKGNNVAPFPRIS